MTRARGLAGFASAISGPVNSTDVFVGVLTATSMTVSGSASIGGTVTYEDVSNVDSVGIITAQAGIRISGGNLGIGTNDPTGKLEIAGNNSSQVLQFGNGTKTGYFVSRTDVNRSNAEAAIHIHDFRWNGTAVARIKGLTGDDTTNKDNGHLTFETSGGSGVSERMRIAADGNVGIGTISPSEDLHLNRSDSADVSIKFTNTTATSGLFVGINASEEAQIWHTENKPLKFATNNTERMRIAADGNVGIGTDSPQQKLCIAGPGASAIIDIKRTNTTATGSLGAINFTSITGNSCASMAALADGDDSGAHIRFKTTSAAGENDPYGSSTTEALRITSAQGVYMGNYFDPVNNLRDAQTTTDRQSKVQIVGNSGPAAGLALVSYANGASGYYSPHIWLAKSDTNTTGNNNRVEDGEDLGSICFAGNDGTRFLNAAAIITEVDGGAGANDMPGRLEFHVCANGASSLTERFRIQNNGNLLASDTTIGALSDSRLKTNISDFTYDLELFKQFQPRTFDWINPELHDNAVGQRGFIAQEIESVDATYVFESKIKESSDDSQLVGDDNVAKSAKLGKNDAMYISVIQQLISKIETLETKVAALEGN